MVMFSRSTKPRPRHEPRVEALEERLALNVGTAAPPIAHQSPAAIGETNSGTATPAVPFKGSTDYTRSPDPAQPGRFDGTGIGTYTGRSTTVAFIVPQFDQDNHPIGYLVREGVITAANGDQISISGEATFTSYNYTPGTGGTATATGWVDITGGTGRFAGATGRLNFEDEFTLDSNGRVYSDHQTITEGSWISF